MATGLNELRFECAEALLDDGAALVDETGRERLEGGRLLLAVQATRATHIFESVIALCRIGRGVPASMLNRALFEEVLNVHWVAAHPVEAPQPADAHEALSRLGERLSQSRFDRGGDPLSEEETKDRPAWLVCSYSRSAVGVASSRSP